METTTTNASASKASKAQDANNAPAPVKMTAAETYAVAAALLKEHGTTSVIKAISASQRAKYGAQVWASIWASVKDLRAKDINDANVRKGAPLAAAEYAKIDGLDVSKYASQTLTDYNASK